MHRPPGSVNMLCGSSKYILAERERLDVKLKNVYFKGRGCFGESDEKILSSILLLSQTVSPICLEISKERRTAALPQFNVTDQF